jgi:hypothetical protein
MATAHRLPFEFPAPLPLVWALMGNCVGDNNQLLALAEALGFPFEAKPLSYNQLRRLPFLRHGLTILARQAREEISPPWPDLVFCTGYGSVPIARYIREQSRGRAKLVHIGNPRCRIDDFDLQITTPQYAREPAANMLALPFPIGNPAKALEPTSAEMGWLRTFPRPLRLIAVGGPARYWALDHEALHRAIHTLQQKEPSGSLIVATSHRTRPRTRALLDELLNGSHEAIVDDFPRFGVLLAAADEIYVTADSVSMISEAVFTGKPVGTIAIRRSLRGLLNHWLWERPTGHASPPNFVKFWAMLARDRLVGTVDVPLASQVCDTVDAAADAVRSIMASGDIVDGKRVGTAANLGADGRAGGRQRSGDRAGGSDWAAFRGEAAALQPNASPRPPAAGQLAAQPDERVARRNSQRADA